MPLPSKRPREGEQDRRRWTHSDSPLVASKVTISRKLEKTKEVHDVTPSPQQESTAKCSSIQLSSLGKRQLFRSKQPTSTIHNIDGAPKRSLASLAQRGLFRSESCGHAIEKHRVRSKTIADSPAVRLKKRGENLETSNREGKYQSNSHGFTSWDSLASVASVPISPSKPKDTTRAMSPPARKRARVMVGFMDNHSTKSIPLELVSLLLPPGLKSTTRLPHTHEEVLQKAQDRRKKQIPMRTALPRRCKTNPSVSVYTEESDDDLFFDTLLHSDKMDGPPVPSEVTTCNEKSASPLHESVPTDTNESKALVEGTAPVENRIGRLDQNVGLSPKRQPHVPLPMDIAPHVKRTRSSHNYVDSDKVVPEPVETPAIVSIPISTKRKRGSPLKTCPIETEIAIDEQRTTKACSRPLRNNRLHARTIASVDKSPRKDRTREESSPMEDRTPVNSSLEKDQMQRVDHHENQRPLDVTRPQEIDKQHEAHKTTQAVRPIDKVKKMPKSLNDSKVRRHKVRFAPTTTTFSLKISVKTSATPSKKGKKRTPPTLSESTVQSIATQITQAYLAQSPNALAEPMTNHGNVNGSDDDQIEDFESDTTSSEEMDSDAEEQDNAKEVMQRNEQYVTPTQDKGNDEDSKVVDNFDARSIASEITMDVDLLRGEQEGKDSRPVVATTNKKDEISKDCDSHFEDDFLVLPGECDINDDDRKEEYNPKVHVEDGEMMVNNRRNDIPLKVTQLAEIRHERSNRGKRMPNPSNISRYGVEASKSSFGTGKRRRLTSTDSLAGCSFTSMYSTKSTEEVPIEVSVNRRPGLIEMSRKNQVHGDSDVDEEFERDKSQEPDQNSKAWRSVEDIDETVVTDKSNESRRLQRSDRKCGKCFGCKQAFDCLTCSKCITTLQQGRFRYGQGTGCLKRICKVLSSKRPMDTLCRATKSLISAKDTASLNPEVDDASMKSFSETGSVYSTASKMRRSRAARLWSRRWSNERKKFSSMTSLASESQTDVPRDTSKKRRSGSRNKKAKSLLHDLELPMPTDGSVASILERRRSLRALMEYDEADQDWL